MSRGPVWTYGRFVWHELLTPDMARSQAFYAELVGWKYQSFAGGGHPYHMILVDGLPQGGLLAAGSPADGPAAAVMGYVSVADVDGAARTAAETGGEVLVPPLEVPGVGRLAVLADPTGASLSIMRSAGGDAPERPGGGSGRFCWDQLECPPDALEAARRFYRAVFGWTTEPAGSGERFQSDGRARAGLVATDGGGTGRWLSCVGVDDLAAARQRAVRLGGQVVADQGGDGLAVITDSAGSTIGLRHLGAAGGAG